MHTTLSRLSDHELLRHARNEFDSLTSTNLERELARRLDDALDGLNDAEEWVDLADGFGVSAAEVQEVLESHPGDAKTLTRLLSILSDHDINDPDQLKELIEVVQKFNAIAQDSGDIFDRLQSLITKAQE